MNDSPAAIVERGTSVDARHDASVAVVDGRGNLVAELGRPEVVWATRSSIKPFQALALVASGGAAALGLETDELAIATASHSGTDEHVRVVQRLLARSGATPDDLGCGAHLPIDYRITNRTPLAGEDKDVLRHNCSGKHAGFLALARHLGESFGSYLAPESRTQTLVRETLTRVFEVGEMPGGTDGCGAPNYALSLVTLARGTMKLRRASASDSALSSALGAVRDAMLAYPELVSGKNRFDHDLMTAFPANAVCKTGAEAIVTLAFAEPHLGIAIKVHDGADRALPPICLAVLAELGVLPSVLPENLARHRAPLVRNYRGVVTGRIVSNLKLHERAAAP